MDTRRCRVGCNNRRKTNHVCCRSCWRRVPDQLRCDLAMAVGRKVKIIAVGQIYRYLRDRQEAA